MGTTLVTMADTLVLRARDSGSLRSDEPDVPVDSDRLVAGASDGCLVRGLLRFDPGDELAGRHIEQATLRLYHAGNAGANPDFPMRYGLCPLPADWTGETTWATQPRPMTEYRASFGLGGKDRAGWVELDVTELIRCRADGVAPSPCFVLIGQENVDQAQGYQTLDRFGGDDAGEHAPLITVTHSPAPEDAGPRYRVANFFMGNHRAVFRVDEETGGAGAVRVHIPWRRRDLNPETKRVVVVDSKTGERVSNTVAVEVNAGFGDIVFEPVTGAGVYYAYYLAYEPNPSPFGDPGTYEEPEDTAEPSWLDAHRLTPEGIAAGQWAGLPEARYLEIQSRPDHGVDGGGKPHGKSNKPDEIEARRTFNSYYPMEVVATADEVDGLLARFPDRAYFVFPEDYAHPVKMPRDIPWKWTHEGPRPELRGDARPGQSYAFQLGVWASREALEELSVTFTDLRGEDSRVIGRENIGCINVEGVTPRGEPFSQALNLEQGQVQPLWSYVEVPEDAAGRYEGVAQVTAKDQPPTDIHLVLDVAGDVMANRGDERPRLMGRIRWLNSTLGMDDEVVPPYTPIAYDGTAMEVLNRRISFDETTGLPAEIRSNGRELLTGPVELVVLENNARVDWAPAGTRAVRRHCDAYLDFDQPFEGGSLGVNTEVRAEFDGCVNYVLTVTPRRDTSVQDIGIRIPVRRESADYMTGLEKRGGCRPATWSWSWDPARVTGFVWLGIPEAGLQFRMHHERDEFFGFDTFQQIGLPEDWHNAGKGGCGVREEGPDTVLVRVWTGDRQLKAGEPLRFKFWFIVTPFRPVNERQHWAFRRPAICFQGAAWNPYMNYPFLTPESTGRFYREKKEEDPGAHLVIYYTARELSAYCAELWALRSLGGEVLNRARSLIYYEDKTIFQAPGGGYPWLQEHLVTDYSPGWRHPLPGGETDPAVGLTGSSRWHNYYVEGMDFIMKHVAPYGLYLDGIGCDRRVIQRMARVIHRNRPGALIWFHSGDTFDGGDLRISTSGIYLGQLAYTDELWFGEGFDYNAGPDYYLVEISGIPYGAANTMLNYQNGGNQWRGMVYGMTGVGNPARESLHAFWDRFGIQDAEWLGYWSEACPVRTGREEFPATVYRKKGAALVSVASWSPEPESVALQIDWDALGIDPARATVTAPAIEHFQPETVFAVGDPIPVDPARGWLLVLREETDAP